MNVEKIGFRAGAQLVFFIGVGVDLEAMYDLIFMFKNILS